MKKNIFLLTCLISIFLFGCMVHNPKHSTIFVVTDITITKNDNMALYRVREYPHSGLEDKWITFFDNKYKFVVGDTIQLIKKYN